MASLPGGCTSAEQFSNYVHDRVKECIMKFMSKEATARHLRDRYQIVYECTVIAWCNLERWNPEFFTTYFDDDAPNARALAQMAEETSLDQLKEETGSYSPPKEDSAMSPRPFTDTREREQEKQGLVPREAANANDGTRAREQENQGSKDALDD